MHTTLLPTSTAVAAPATKSSKKSRFVDNSQIGLFCFDEDEGLFVPATEAIHEENAPILALNSAVNYRITASDRLGQGSLRNKAQDNLRAIRTLKQILREGRNATPEEQAILVRYVGWGGIPKIFEEDAGEWTEVGHALQRLLTNDEYRKAASSVINAHYTPEGVIRGLYDVLGHLGFSGGNVLEPAAGIGHFVGLMPEDMTDNTEWTAIELDPVTGEIAKALYPDSNVLISGFEDAFLSNDAYDLAIGNVPFGQYSVYDPVYNPKKFSIHNYFFVRSLAAVRPGGAIAMLTSRYTLDQADPTVRQTLAEQADLVAAFRLPETTFRENANTEVVTDLLILRKREPDAAPAGPAWMEITPVSTAEGDVQVNEYFAAHPEMILGTLGMRSSQHGPTLTVRGEDGEDLRQALTSAGRRLSGNGLFDHHETSPKPIACVTPTGGIAAAKDGSFLLLDGKLCRREGTSIAEHGLKNNKDVRRVTNLVRIRDAVREVLRTQNDDETDAAQDTARRELNYLYDVFVSEFGPINTETRTTSRIGRVSVRRPNLSSFRRDPDAMLVAALECYDPEKDAAVKADIFFRRVVRPRSEITSCERVEDALLITLDRVGHVDLQEISRLWGNRSDHEILDALGSRVYRNPETGHWETADAYLSGQVRKKLRAAEAAAETDESYQVNVQALAEIQPEDLQPSEIDASLGSSWIPKDELIQFIRDLLGRVATNVNFEIAHLEREALWRVSGPPHVVHSVEATRTWGTERANTLRIIEDSLNQRLVQVFDTVEEYDEVKQKIVKKSVKNIQESLDAQEKQQQIEERFADWVWKDVDRAKRLLTRYNEMFNGIRLRIYDGSHLTLPNASDSITLDPHQKNGVWRILQEGNTLIAHVVGSGKTFLSVASAMESKRLGLSNKPSIVVPNHMVEQFSREALQLYPNAHILCVSAEDLAGEGRRRFMSRIATGTYDLIIMTHSAFGKMPISAEFEENFIAGELASYEALLEDADPNDRLSRKQLEQAKKRLEARLDQLSNRAKKDNILSWEELGIDAIWVDEAHKFKNLDTPTKIQGIPRASKPSQRSQDLLMKTLYLETLRPSRGVVFMTGTPVSNTIAEVYVMLRYLAPRLLEDAGIHHFDAWAATFTRRIPVLELAPDGATYRIRTRFHFQNVAELVSMFRMVADIQTAEMLQLPRPKLEGGDIQSIAAPASPELKMFVAELVDRAEKIRNGEVKPWEDNMLAVTNDGRKAALDVRLIYESACDYADSKINKCVENVARIYHETAERRLTQLIFCDLSTPKKDGSFDVYHDIRGKLVQQYNVKPEEISFVHDASDDLKKARLFKDMREGRIRILIASTEKAGIGTNVQDLLYAVHHLDAPWRPSDIEQRDGRILRRGNLNALVWIFRYVTKESFDAYQWNTLEYKARFIAQIMCGEVTTRRIEDIDSTALSFAQLKALASGDPRVMEKEAINADVIRLKRAQKAFQDRQFQTRLDLASVPERLHTSERMLARTEADLLARQDTHGDLFEITLEKERFTDRAEAGPRFRDLLVEYTHTSLQRRVIRIGRFAGFDLEISVHKGYDPEVLLMGEREHSATIRLNDSNSKGNLQLLENLPRRMETDIKNLKTAIDHLQGQLTELERIKNEAFPHQETLDAAVKRQRVLEEELSEKHRPQDFSGIEEATLEPEEDDDSGDIPAAA